MRAITLLSLASLVVGAPQGDTGEDAGNMETDTLQEIFGVVEVNNDFDSCEEYTEKFGYECVPFDQCHNGTIVTDGAGLIDLRTLTPELSKCPGSQEVCCKDPDFIPPTEQNSPSECDCVPFYHQH